MANAGFKPLNVAPFNERRLKLFVDARGMLYRYYNDLDTYKPMALRRQFGKFTQEAVRNCFYIHVGKKLHTVTQQDLRKFYETGIFAQ